MTTFDAAERRRRLGVRHALASPVTSAEDVTTSVVALHSTDPAAMVLSVLARLERPSIAEVERALYVDRSIVRLLAMRRTVFAVPSDEFDEFAATVRHSVAGPEHRKLLGLLRASGVDDAETRVEQGRAAVLAAAERLGEFSSADLQAADPLLATRVDIGAGSKYATQQSLASRLLTVMSVEGSVVRTRPEGAWNSYRYRWAARGTWLPSPVEQPDEAEARARVAERWLARFGPARLEDLQWWTGWTKGHTRVALAALDTVEVSLEDGTGLVLADDLEPTAESAPWVALLPALDPTTMGWKHRDWYLGPHAERVFDNVGNAGPTVWQDGRIVGGWAIRDDGSVVTSLFTDVGREAAEAIDARAARLEELLGGVVVKVRARRWTAVEQELRG